MLRIVASGRKKALPKGFWEGDEGLERIRAVVGHLVANGLDPLSLTDSKARALHIRRAVYRAGGLFELIDMVFPGKYLGRPWSGPRSRPYGLCPERVWGDGSVRAVPRQADVDDDMPETDLVEFGRKLGAPAVEFGRETRST